MRRTHDHCSSEVRGALIPKCPYTACVNPLQSAPPGSAVPPHTYGTRPIHDMAYLTMLPALAMPPVLIRNLAIDPSSLPGTAASSAAMDPTAPPAPWGSRSPMACVSAT